MSNGCLNHESLPYPVVVFCITFALLFSGYNVVFASNNNGSGTCWNSGAAWTNNLTYYQIDGSIPSGWGSSINTSASTWNNVTPSPFVLAMATNSNNKISKGTLANNSYIALTSVYASPTTISQVITVFNQNMSFTTSLPPPQVLTMFGKL